MFPIPVGSGCISSFTFVRAEQNKTKAGVRFEYPPEISVIWNEYDTGEEGRMRIAQVAPLVESVPPKHYGGTERIVAYLTEELVRLGHQVTLFASGDSVTNAELVPVWRHSFRQDKGVKDYLSREVLLMDHVLQRAGEFDVIHFHTGCLHYLISRHLAVPHVTTLHGRLDTSESLGLYRAISGHADDFDLKFAA